MDNWQRLEAVIKWSNMTTHSFAIAIGLNRSENLYQIKRGRNGISKGLAKRICTLYPQIDYVWILTGQGVMLRGVGSFDQPAAGAIATGVPSFIGDVTLLSTKGETSFESYFSHISCINNCDHALAVSGCAMAPEVPAGSIIIVKRISKKYIVYGEIYLIITCNGALIREIKPSLNPEEVDMVAKNRELFDPITIPLIEIENLYLVRVVINIRA